MSNKYDRIQQLIAAWQVFENSGQVISFKNFGYWLTKNNAPSSFSMMPREIDTEQNDLSMAGVEFDEKKQFLTLISRLSRFQEFYLKKFFEGLPINNIHEFNFLQFINKNISVKKKEVIEKSLVEYTTGIDIIKRFIKCGLVTESKDEIDKRSKRIRITALGKKLLFDATITYRKLEILFFGNLQTLNWQEFLPALQRMEEFHTKVFMECYNCSGYKLLEHIQSKTIGTEF